MDDGQSVEADDSGLIRIPPETLTRLVREILVAEGADEAMAKDTADGLVHASVRGVDSHGVRLLPHYVKGLRGGRINPKPQMRFEQRAAAVGHLDADHAFGHHAGTVAMRHAMSIARESGIGSVAVANSSHCGALAFLALPAAEAGMVGIVMTHATPRLRTPGGTRALFGNNPTCVVAPIEGEEPFCFDASTSTSTFNAVRLAAERGETLPPGVAADASGVETTDPEFAEQLIPIGDYKGYGLSMVVDIFCAMLTGMPSGPDVSGMFDGKYSEKRCLGHVVTALDINAFIGLEVTATRMKELKDRVHESAPSPESSVRPMIPGERELVEKRVRHHRGIPVPQAFIDSLATLAPQARDIDIAGMRRPEGPERGSSSRSGERV